MITKNDLYRFIGFVRVMPNGCWDWQGDRDRKGYGKFWFNNATGRASRFAAEFWHGPIPAEQEPDHLCRRPWCVNPDHLEVVTRRTNLLRGTSPVAINAAKLQCVHGHPFTPENTYTYKDGGRYCRTCNKIRARARYQPREKGSRAQTRS